jgi:PBP1b-binding outer membrane lipoprotein LpoB
MKNMKAISLFILSLLLLASCTVINQQSAPPPQKTQLQTRQVQTREYDTNDVKLVMKAVLNVLQGS